MRSRLRTRALGILLASVLGAAALVDRRGSTTAHAAPPESVPAECRAQVAAGLRVLELAFARKARRIPAGQKGTIEFAIASYAPPRLHAVEEGALPSPRPGATCPPGMANVGTRFCVDRYEGSLIERLDDGSTTPHSPFLTPSRDSVYIARSVADVVPQGYISASQAERACLAAGKRLCHPVEWRAACGGSEGFIFPYGPVHVAGKCHDKGAAPMLAFHAATMKRGWGLTELNDPRNNQLEGTVDKTGASPDCVNDYGAYDMVGNLHEWTRDPNGTFQGGYWLDTSQHGEGCAYRTISHGFEYHDYSTGFRCCADLVVPAQKRAP